MAVKKVVDSERLDGAMTATADAIREKTSGTEPIPWNADTGFAEAVAGITGGGSSVDVDEKDVNFYDYDGTLLYSYTVEEAAALTELPPLPTQPGLICQEWNWNLDDIKAMGRAVDVGTTYITDDGKTRIYISIHEGHKSPMLGCAVKGTVTVNWGDGSEPETLTGTSITAVKWTQNHTYANHGDYVITLTVSGDAALTGKAEESVYMGFLRNTAENSVYNYAYLNSIKKIELGANMSRVGSGAFAHCYSLSSIAMPKGVTLVGASAFEQCKNLRCVILPDGVTRPNANAFASCCNLEHISLPISMAGLREGALSECDNLEYLYIPKDVEITEDNEFIFYNSKRLSRIIIEPSVDVVPLGIFEGCYNLQSVTFCGDVGYISAQAFRMCYSAHVYDFTKCGGIPTLSSLSAFEGIPANCEIRVPAVLADEWKAATNWAEYADRIVGV